MRKSIDMKVEALVGFGQQQAASCKNCRRSSACRCCQVRFACLLDAAVGEARGLSARRDAAR